jgi:hypothetical protein
MWLWCFFSPIFHLLTIAYLTNRHAWVIFYHYLTMPFKIKSFYCYYYSKSSTRGISIYAQYASCYRSYEILLFTDRIWVQ